MKINLDELTREWSYRVHTGIPDPKDSGHVNTLREILEEKKYPRRFIEKLLGELDLVKNKDTGNVYTVQKANKSKHDVIKKNASQSDIDKQDSTDKPKQDKEPSPEKKPQDAPADSKEALIKQFLAQQERDKAKMMAMLNDPDTSAADAVRSLQAKQKSDEAFYLYTPLNKALQAKGFGNRVQGIDPDTGETITNSEKTLKRYTRELQSILQDVTTEDKDSFIEYLNAPETHVPLPQERSGNMVDALESAGIPREVAKRLLKHTTQDDQKKGVGMGEFMMAMIYKNVKNSNGAGDLAFIDEDGQQQEFEIKGHNATLGAKPDETNHFKRDSLSKLGLEVVREKGKQTVIQYGGEEYAPGQLPNIMANAYTKLSDDEKSTFKTNFMEMMLSDVFSHPKDTMDAEVISKFMTDPELAPDFSDPRSINNTIGLLNHVNYVTMHGFDKFLAHDMGASDKREARGLNNGNYTFLSGSPIEQAKQLKAELENPKTLVMFQPVTANLSRPRIGHYGNAKKRKTNQ
tara:strand:- start:20 stop:1573 length:1554 start_codon:yes stop_codon:yes gene_type:complete